MGGCLHMRKAEVDGFPDGPWYLLPPAVVKYKASSLGRLCDGRLVALDYAAPPLSSATAALVS
jgi:hypothetical protein